MTDKKVNEGAGINDQPLYLVAKALGQAIFPQQKFWTTWKFVLCIFLLMVITFFGWNAYKTHLKQKVQTQNQTIGVLASENRSQNEIINTITILQESAQVAVAESIKEKEEIVTKAETVKEQTREKVAVVKKKAKEKIEKEPDPVKVEQVKTDTAQEIDKVQLTAMWQTYCNLTAPGQTAGCMAQAG